jgi:hypothetical protein
MLHARKPTEEERAELQQMRRQAVGRVSQRAHMVLLSIQGQSEGQTHLNSPSEPILPGP